MLFGLFGLEAKRKGGERQSVARIQSDRAAACIQHQQTSTQGGGRKKKKREKEGSAGRQEREREREREEAATRNKWQQSKRKSREASAWYGKRRGRESKEGGKEGQAALKSHRLLRLPRVRRFISRATRA